MKKGQAAARSGVWKVSLRLPDDVKAIIKRQAAAHGLSMNSWVVRALERKVSEDLAEMDRVRR